MNNRDTAEHNLAIAFNEWMRLTIEEPDKFELQFQSVIRYLDETKASDEPTYGRECAAFLMSLMDKTRV